MKVFSLSASFLICFGISISASGQLSFPLSANNIDAEFTANGGLFQDEHSFNRFRIKDADRTAIFAGSLWISGKVNTQLRAALQEHYLLNDTNAYPLKGTDFAAGPIADSYSDPSYENKYNKVWKVNKAQIDYHRKNYNQFPYVPDFAIENWPGNGDVSNGEANTLAPFYDNDNDGVYDPYKGDYPLIRGDEAVYVIFNDDNPKDTLSTTPPLKTEIHLMAYAYDSLEFPALHNSIFLNYQIWNRSSESIDSLIVSNWLDVDLGNHEDDLFGSDSANNFIFFRNGSPVDDGPFGFGANPPALGVLNLSKSAGGHIYHRIDLSRLASNQMTPPDSSIEFRRYMEQKWKNGNSLIVEEPDGDGFVTSDTGQVTRWAFDVSHNWTPDYLGNFRNVFSTVPSSLAPGQKLCLDYAFIYARDSTQNDLFASVDALFQSSQEIEQFYTNGNFQCLDNVTSIEENSLFNDLQLFPNPTTGKVAVDFGATYRNAHVQVLSSTGQLVTQQEIRNANQINLEIPGPAGIYLIKVKVEGNSPVVMKVVKDRMN